MHGQRLVPRGSVYGFATRSSASPWTAATRPASAFPEPAPAPNPTLPDGTSCGAGELCVSGICTAVPGNPPSPIDPTVATDFGQSTTFLYEGPNAQQVGVAPGTIDRKRAGVFRGRILDRAGQGVANAIVRVLDRPEYGFTRTATDGVFSLAINGGEQLRIDCRANGFLPVQRTEKALALDYASFPDVVLTAVDPARTIVDLAGASAIQVAQATPSTDASGARQSIILFKPGTQATAMRTDGTSQPLPTVTVHSTEYTVGEQGPAAMPATLPPSSGYTYAVELMVEEANGPDVKEVRFSQPVIHYVDNFLHFPAGTVAPAGSQNRTESCWAAEPNGRIIRILSTIAGIAEIDANGDGAADDAAALAALGITDEERATLASLYLPGESVWRNPIEHFSPWDINWPFSFPLEAGPPPGPDPEPEVSVEGGSCEAPGSIVDCNNQLLGEEVDIVGTPFNLVYSSAAVPGIATGTARAIIPLTGSTVSPVVKRIDLTIGIAGQTFTQSFTPAPNQTTTFDWDGRDVFGRKVIGPQTAAITVSNVYDGVYNVPLDDIYAAFGRFSHAPEFPIEGDRAREEISFPRKRWIRLNHPDAASEEGLGGWALDAHRRYDAHNATVTTGGSLSRSVGQANRTANLVRLPTPSNGFWALRAAPDSSMVYTSAFDNFGPTPGLYRIGNDGSETALTTGHKIKWVAFDGNQPVVAQADPALQGLVPNDQIDRVNGDGSLSRVAGNTASVCLPASGFPVRGDEGPATEACLGYIYDIEVRTRSPNLLHRGKPGQRAFHDVDQADRRLWLDS